MAYFTLEEQPETVEALGPLHMQFPDFVLEGDEVNRHYWSQVGLYEHFPEYQFVLRGEDGQIRGCGHTIPLFWDGSGAGLPAGYDAALEAGFSGLEKEKNRTFCVRWLRSPRLLTKEMVSATK